MAAKPSPTTKPVSFEGLADATRISETEPDFVEPDGTVPRMEKREALAPKWPTMKTSSTSGSFTPGVEGPSLNLNASFDAGLEVLAAKSSESVWSASPTSSVGDVQAPASLVVSNTAARADVPRHAAQQISASVQILADDTAEVSLNPEELGRVRIAISTLETGVLIALTAERGETVEMLRRHESDLETAFRDMGHTNIAF